MKKLLFLCLPLALLVACGEKAHKTTIEFDKEQTGIRILSVKDTFNAYKGSYFVTAEIQNDTKDTIKGLSVDVNYIDKEGDIIAQSNALPKDALAPGAKVTLENKYDFSTGEESRPYKIQVKAKNSL